MPQAAAGAIITAVGVTGMAATAITVATYAVVGAAIGAITSAVAGGDIGRGALWGAVGGAVVGGISVAAGAAADAVSTGAGAMAESGSTAGMVNTAQTVTGASQTVYGVGQQAGSIAIGQGTAGSAGGGLLGSMGKEFASTALKDFAVGGIKSYMDYQGQKDALEQGREDARESREWQSAEAEKNRAAQLELAKVSSGGAGSNALAVAMENNKAAMARQKEAQAHDKAVWGLNRDAKKEDQKGFSDSVIAGAQKQYDSKVGQIENFMSAPSWLQPRNPSMGADRGQPQPQQQAQPVQQTQPQYVAQQQAPQILPQGVANG